MSFGPLRPHRFLLSQCARVRRGADILKRRFVKRTDNFVNGTSVQSALRELRPRVARNSAQPIHPLRLCRELRDVMPRDAILCVDGQGILNFARQAIPTFMQALRLNSGTFGTMGVGLPRGLGATTARPGRRGRRPRGVGERGHRLARTRHHGRLHPLRDLSGGRAKVAGRMSSGWRRAF